MRMTLYPVIFKTYKCRKLNSIFVCIFLMIFILYSNCGRKGFYDSDVKILAKIGNKTISVGEFYQRSEFTIRPKYCRLSNNVHKKIILNSLIAEKLLAIEAEKNKDFYSNFKKSESIQNYIVGRKEQAMRQLLFRKEGIDKVTLNEEEIRDLYNSIGRTYKIEYFYFRGDSIAKNIISEMENFSFEEVYKKIWGKEKVPTKDVSWKTMMNPVVREALFSKPLEKGKVLGPIRYSPNEYLVMKILGWEDKIAVSKQEQLQRMEMVKDELKRKKAIRIYDRFVLKIMKGKRLDFYKDTFYGLADYLKKIYLKNPDETKELFKDALFNQEVSNYDSCCLNNKLEELLDKPLLKVNDRIWTVRSFLKDMQRHPLVFRKKIRRESEYYEQLKLAMVDLVRDIYLTEEAYKRGYDKDLSVRRYTTMWYDALLSQYYLDWYLKTKFNCNIDSLNTISIIEKYLNPYIDKLQRKYSDFIWIDVDEFNRIKLTRIDMFVFQRKQPFPDIVPNFPQLTTDTRLDYGNPMNSYSFLNNLFRRFSKGK